MRRVTGRTSGDASGTMETPVLVPAGTGKANYHDFTSGGRAGDLSGINVDPSDGTFWAVNEFANTEATANWGTAIANFTSQFAFEGDAPREWAERLYNIQRWTRMERGGHFAPTEEPVALARDIAAFFASLI